MEIELFIIVSWGKTFVLKNHETQMQYAFYDTLIQSIYDIPYQWNALDK